MEEQFEQRSVKKIEEERGVSRDCTAGCSKQMDVLRSKRIPSHSRTSYGRSCDGLHDSRRPSANLYKLTFGPLCVLVAFLER